MQLYVFIFLKKILDLLLTQGFSNSAFYNISNMANFKEVIRIGICKHTGRKILQIKDSDCDDAVDEEGWFCLHDETVDEEVENILEFKYKIKQFIYIN